MAQALAVLTRADIAECVAAGVAALAGWLVRRERTSAMPAAMLGLLGAAALLAALAEVTQVGSVVLRYAALLAFLASGACLLSMRDAHPYSRLARVTAGSTLAMALFLDTAVATLSALSADATAQPVLEAVAAGATLAAWASCVVEPSERLWRSSAGRPPVQRARMRLLSCGSVLSALALANGVVATTLPLPPALAATESALLVAVLMLWAGVAPPRWLRQVWRDRVGNAQERAMDALLLYAPDQGALARRGLEWAIHMTGGVGGAITTINGEILAAIGSRAVETSRLDPQPHRRRIVAVDMPTVDRPATLAVDGGDFAPFFGGEDLEMLRSYARSLALALDRFGLESEAVVRTAQHEAVLRAIDEMGEGLLVKQNGRVVYVNDAYRRITGLSSLELGHDDAAARTAHGIEKHAPHPAATSRRETEVMNGEGRRVFVESSVCDVTSGLGDMSVALLRDITERKKAERAVLDRARMLDLSQDAIFMRALVPPVITYWSQGAEKAYGHSSEQALGKDPHKLLLSVFPKPQHEIDEEALRTGEWQGEVIQQRRDGTTRIMATRWSLRINDQGAPDGILEVTRDVTDRRRAERLRSLQTAVTRALADSATVAEAASDVIQALCESLDYQLGELWLLDPTDETLTLRHSWHVSEVDGPVFEQGARRLALHRGQDLAGRAWAEQQTVSVRDVADDQLCLRRGLAVVVGLKAGAAIPVAAEGRRLGAIALYSRVPRLLEPEIREALDALGRQVGGFLERKRAASAIEDSAERIEQLAATDALTGLFNRRAFEQALDDLAGQPFALLSLDVDLLDRINQDHGRETGDFVLRTIAQTLQTLVRDNDVVARVGGDEFAVLLPGAGAPEAGRVAERMRAAMHAISVPRARPRLSVGWTAAPAGADPSLVRRAADEVLFRAKSMGRDRVEGEPFEVRVLPDRSGTREAELISSVLSSQHINAVFQPIVDLDSGAIIGYEALARPAGHAPTASVEAMFTAARRLGRIRDLDWLCRRAAVRSARFLPGAPSLFLNVSAVAFLDPVHPVDQLMLLLRWAGWPPERTVLEITEQEAVRDLSRARLVVAAYREHGVRFALDDVGEGHSSLELLAAVNPEFIKMAASLTGAIGHAGPFSALQATIAFAASSRAQVVAEGIETEEMAEQMRSLGVPLGQGFLLGKPAPAEEFARGLPTVLRRRGGAGQRRRGQPAD